MNKITQCCLKITKVRTQLILHNPLFTQEFYDYTRLFKNRENSYTTKINQLYFTQRANGVQEIGFILPWDKTVIK